MERKTAVVLDISTATYCLLPVMNELWTRLEERQGEFDHYKQWEVNRRAVWEMVLKAQVMEMLTLEWLGTHINLVEPVIFLAYDRKDVNNEYWRHEWLRGLTPLLPTRQLKRRKRVFDSVDDKVGRLVSELPVEPIAYKGGRDYTQNELNRLKKAVRHVLKPVNVGHLGQVGYEADDFMATVAQVNAMLPEDEQRNIVLCCNDSDVLGLVSERVSWFDMPRKHFPLVRSNLTEINQWRTDVKHQPKLAAPSDIWAEKARDGDKSDNLPPTGEAMLTLPAIDLLNPPDEHKLWQCPSHQQHIKHWLTSTQPRYHNTTGRVIMDKVRVVNVFR